MPLLRKLSADERRSFGHWTMELVIVIAGVLIALWLQDWGQRRQAVQELKAAEDAIHDEVKSALLSLIWRQAVSKCHFDRAELLKSMLLASGDQWPGLTENALARVMPRGPMGNQTVVPSVYYRPLDSFTKAAWDSALATGALAPMDRQRFGQLVELYGQIQLLSDTRDGETQAASKLSALAFPLQITPDTRAEMLQAVYEIDRSRFTFDLIGPDFSNRMRELGWNDKRDIEHWIADDEANDKRLGIRWRECVARARNPFAER